MEIEELRRICHEETERARQMRTGELCLSKRERGTFYDESALVSDLDSARQGECLEWREFYDPETASSSGMSKVPSQPSRIPSPSGECFAAILDFRTTHGIRWVLQEMFLKSHLLQKEYLRPYHELPWGMEKDWDETAQFEQYRLHDFLGILMPGILGVVLEELILKVVRWKLRCYLGIAFRKIPRTTWLSVLERQLQDRSVRKHIHSWTHIVVDQWSGNFWIYRRSCDVVNNLRRVYSWFWDASCEHCVCVEKDYLHYFLRQESQCWREARSKIQPILERNANCEYDQWPLSVNWSFVQYLLWRWWPRFRYKMGSDLIRNKWDASGKCPWRSVQKQITRFWTTQTVFTMCNQDLSRDRVASSYQKLRRMVR